MKTLKTTIIVLAIIAAMWALLAFAAQRDAELNRISACVANKAHADGFTNNPYSEEAWQRYVAMC